MSYSIVFIMDGLVVNVLKIYDSREEEKWIGIIKLCVLNRPVPASFYKLAGKELDLKMAVLLLPLIKEAFGIDTAKHPRRKTFDRRKLNILLNGYLPLLLTEEVMGKVAVKLGSGWHYDVEYLEDDRILTEEEETEK